MVAREDDERVVQALRRLERVDDARDEVVDGQQGPEARAERDDRRSEAGAEFALVGSEFTPVGSEFTPAGAERPHSKK